MIDPLFLKFSCRLISKRFYHIIPDSFLQYVRVGKVFWAYTEFLLCQGPITWKFV